MANQSKCIGIVTVWGARGIMLSYLEGKQIGTAKAKHQSEAQAEAYSPMDSRFGRVEKSAYSEVYD